MKNNLIYALALSGLLFWSCGEEKKDQAADQAVEANAKEAAPFEYKVDEFADLRILRYQIDGFEDLTLKEQKLVYYLTQAGLAGRDIMWAQNYRHNLKIRTALESIYTQYDGDKTSEDWKNFEVYLKRVWFSNGIHHHYSNAKIKPDFNQGYFNQLLKQTNTSLDPEAVAVIFNDADAKKVNLSKDADIVLESAINFYGPDVTTADVETFYGAIEVDEKGKEEEGVEVVICFLGEFHRSSGEY